ncbi:hypothetical protein DL770_003646 [Monosporascus sp. CRB-9-2]|nr:hypothetical protein DL770_003646 [Monosporascus sp. CRB-9-2]
MDGSLTFVGRKDAQVKIHGQRVELEEVEYWVQNCISEVSQVVAEIILPRGENPSPMLVVFLQIDDEAAEAGANKREPAAARIFPIPVKVKENLAQHLPSYMTPVVFFSMRELPMTATGKMDRKRLQEIGASYSAEELAEVRTARHGPKRQPTSETEQCLQNTWARVLNIDAARIGLDDSFFDLGGNSIAAMKVVGEARKVGIKLAVADIFRHPALRDLANQSIPIADRTVQEVAPFALLGDGFDVSSFLRDVSTHYRLDPAVIRDAYPCTPLQEGLMSLTSEQSGYYIVQEVLELAPNVAVKDLCTAWEQVARANPILRTRLVQHSDIGLVQVVLDENIYWIDATNLDKYLKSDMEQSMDLGESLTRYALVKDVTGETKWLVWTIHHALCDGWSVRLIVDAVHRAFRGEPIDQGPQFQSFIKYIKDQDNEAMVNYWLRALGDCDCPSFPALPPLVDRPMADAVVQHEFLQCQRRLTNITTPSLVRAAWALVAGRMTNSEEVLFGATVSGRNAPVAGIEAMTAPTFATVPVRVALTSGQKVLDYLEAVQLQATEMIPFEQAGLRQISRMSPHTQKACMFQTLLVIQPQEASRTYCPHEAPGKWRSGDQQYRFNTYALMIEVQLGADSLVISASFDSRVLEPWIATKLLKRLEFAMQQLDSAGTETVVAEIDVMTPQDLEQIWEWNSIVPTPVDQCVHDIIQNRASAQPTAPAICAWDWDGQLSYKELDQFAARVAGQLANLGIKPDTLVPLCFEKSIWAPIAMLGVLKAGGAFVLLDHSLPEQRLQAIVQQLNANFILKDSRVFDFASYAFDVSIHNVFATFASGACLCIPSEEDRRDNISKAMADMGVTIVEFTPSVARLIDPSTVPRLETLVLGGEAVSISDVTPWWGKRIVNVYGPAECLASTINSRPPTPDKATRIGKGAGLVTWVVDPDNHNCLLPPGHVGELLLEGPLVGRGYLNDPEKTAAAFIEDPIWLPQGSLSDSRPGRHGRLYKTGDLVRYHEDGSLSFLGRKDVQVKIRGQRVDLGEVEHWVQDCMPAATQVVVEVIEPQKGGSSPLLAAFLQMGSQVIESGEPDAVAAKILPISADREDKLAQHLPSYMVPTVFVAMRQLPMSATGKTDRRRLRAIGGSCVIQQLTNTQTNGGRKRQATSAIERQLQSIWCRVLNLDPASVGMDDSFLRLGGDSITAMQVSAAARSSSINICLADILRKKTIANLADGLSSSGCTHSALVLPRSMIRDNSLQLSPMQMLKNKKGIWEQRLAPDVRASVCLHVRESDVSDTAQVIAQCREGLDIENGPLFAAVLFDDTRSQKLFLTAHHLVVDLVSWRVLLLELEELLTLGSVSTPPPMGFQSWITLQAQYAAENLDPVAATPFEVRPPLLGYWGMESKENLRRHAVLKRYGIDEPTSSAILSSCNDVSGMRPVELMISALLYSFGLVFPNRPLPPIFSEGHGREPWDDRIDVSTTVGCFTTLWPVQLSTSENSSMQDTIRWTRNSIRSLPRNGWSWFTSHCAEGANLKAFASGFPLEVTFNYEGLYQQLERSGALFERIFLSDEEVPASSLEIRRFALIEIEARVEQGRIWTSVAYHRDMRHQQRILEWVEKYEDTLAQMAKEIRAVPPDWVRNDLSSGGCDGHLTAS